MAHTQRYRWWGFFLLACSVMPMFYLIGLSILFSAIKVKFFLDPLSTASIFLQIISSKIYHVDASAGVVRPVYLGAIMVIYATILIVLGVWSFLVGVRMLWSGEYSKQLLFLTWAFVVYQISWFVFNAFGGFFPVFSLIQGIAVLIILKTDTSLSSSINGESW